MGGAVLSPDPRINQSMNGSSSGGSGSSSSGKQHHHPKFGRSSSHHGGSGGKKKSSPIPASSHGGGGSNTGKELFVLVAAEAMPLSSAGIVLKLIDCDCSNLQDYQFLLILRRGGSDTHSMQY